MSFLQRLRKAWRLTKAIPESEINSLVSVISGTRSRVSRRGVQEMLAAYSTSPWFRGVVEKVSFAAAVVPWRIFGVRAERGSREQRDGATFVPHVAAQFGESAEVRQKVLDQLEAAGRLVELEDHLFLQTLSNPNPVLTGVDTRLITFALVMVAGECGWAIKKNELGAPVEIWPVPPHWIVTLPSEKDDAYTVRLRGGNHRFARDEFIFFRNPQLTNPYGRGSGLGLALSDELETDEYISKFQKTWFFSRGKPDLVVTVKPTPGSGGPTEDELVRARERFDNEYREAQGGSMWTRGDITVTELSQKLVDLDLTEQRTWLKDLTREVVGAPPEIFGDLKSSNRATVTEAIAILAMLTTVPQLERMRAQLQQQLLPLYDPRLVVGYWSPVPADRVFRLEALKVATWAATRGEIRKLQGLEDRGQFDNVHLQPLNVIESEGPPLEPRQRALPVRALAVAQKQDVGDEAERIVQLLSPQTLDFEVTPEIEKTVEKWGNRTLAQLGVEARFDMLNPLVLEHLQRFSAEKIVLINDATKRAVRSTLRAGILAGEGADDLARRLRSAFGQFGKVRSLAIARTEVTSSANFATWGAHKLSGVVAQREWIATLDDRVRDAHAELDGQKVGVDEPFTIDGQQAMFPGGFDDPSLSIACRCTTAAVIAEPKSPEERLELWKGFVEETERDEASVARAARRGFAAQLEILLQAIARAA